MRISFTFLLLFALSFTGNLGFGQSIQSISQGFSVHVYGNYGHWNSNSLFLSDIAGGDPSGLGAGVDLRYGFTSMISGYVGFASLNFDRNDEWEKYNTKLYRFGGQYNFGGSTSKVRPFVKAGGVYQNFNLSYIFINSDPPVDNAKLVSKGWAAEVGGGLKYHFLPEVAFELSVSGQFGAYGSNFVDGREFPFEETIDTQHLFVRLGVGYYFY